VEKMGKWSKFVPKYNENRYEASLGPIRWRKCGACARENWKLQNKQIIGKEKLLKKWQKREYWKLHNKQIIGIGKMLKKWQKRENQSYFDQSYWPWSHEAFSVCPGITI
jgi:hypothetical protein